MAKNPVRKATLRALVNNVLTDIYSTTSTDNIVIDANGNLLSDYLVDLVSKSDMQVALQELKSEILDGAPEILDTLKEISEWIREHGDFTQYLEDLVNTKADKEDLDALSEAFQALSQEFSEKPQIYFASTQPSNLKSGDMWVQPVVNASVIEGLQPTT